MNATYLNELYDDFLFSIQDHSLVNLTDEEIKEDLDYYFRKARGNFKQCRNKLDLLKDSEGNEYFGHTDESGKKVDVLLTDFEKNILTHLMLVEYLKPKVMTDNFLKPAMSDKGFKIHSQANHLRELNLLYRLIQKECNRMITEYTYLDLGED